MGNLKLRFVTETGLISNAVTWFEGGSLWSHVEFVLPDGTFLGARAMGGIAIRASDYIKPKHIERQRIYSIPVADDVLESILTFANSQVGKSYDFTDILGIMTHTSLHNSNDWICSEFVTASCLQAGLRLLNVEPEFVYKITPEMVHLSPVLSGCGV